MNKETIDHLLAKATIIIPTIGRWLSLLQTLESIQKQSISFACIIIVCDGCNFSKSIKIENFLYKNFKIIELPDKKRGANYCRSIGLSYVKTQYTIFLDDDIILYDSWKNAVASAINMNIIATTGDIEPLDSTFLAQARDIRTKISRKNKAIPFAGGNGLIQTEVLRDLGGMEKLPSATKLTLLLTSIGYEVTYIKGMSVAHIHDRGFLQMLNHGFIVGKSISQKALIGGSRQIINISIDRKNVIVLLLNILWILFAFIGKIVSSMKFKKNN